MSYFRSRSQKPAEAYLPLVTSLPTRRRKSAALDAEDTGRAAAGPDASSSDATPVGLTDAPADEDDLMRTIFAELNSTAEPAQVDEISSADPPVAIIPVADVAGRSGPQVTTGDLPASIPSDAETAMLFAVPEPATVEMTETDGFAATKEPVTVPDDDTLRALFSETLGDALAPELMEPEPPAPTASIVPLAAQPDSDGGFSGQSDAAVIGMLRDAEAAVADPAPETPARRRWSWRRKDRKATAARPTTFIASVPAIPAIEPPEEPARPARAARKPIRISIRIPGSRGERWLLGCLALCLVLAGLGAVAGGLAALAATLIVVTLAILSRDVVQCIPGDTGLPLPSDMRRLVPALTLLALGLGLCGLALPLVQGFASWFFTLVSMSIWLAQGPARFARDAAASHDRAQRRTAQTIFALLLLPHRPATERLLHRRLAGTPEDPLTAETGESFYAFAARAVPDALRDALAMERQIMTPRLGSPRGTISPLLMTALASLAWLGIATALFGPLALSALIALALCVEVQLLMTDYLATYGLQRRQLSHDRFEPLGPAHRWVAPPAFGNLAAALTGTRPARPGQDGAPVLPYNAALMAARALLPPLWHGDLDARVMSMTKASLRGEAAPLR